MVKRRPKFGSAEYECSVVCGGLELLLAAVQADDPKQEILVRVKDIMSDMEKVLAAVGGSGND